MIHSSSEATSNSPTPISPFSTYSRLSEATSDGQSPLSFPCPPLLFESYTNASSRLLHPHLWAQPMNYDHVPRIPTDPFISAGTYRRAPYFYPITEAPDLGAFNTVFRELQQFQIGPPRILHTTLATIAVHADHDVDVDYDHERDSASPRSARLSALPTDSEANAGSTVWTQGIIASYFDPSVTSVQTRRSAVDDRSRGTASATDDDHTRVRRRLGRLYVRSASASALGSGEGGDGEDSDEEEEEDSDSETEGEGDALACTTVVGSVVSDVGGVVVDDPEHPTLGTIDSVMEFLMSERDRVQAGRLVERRKIQHYSSTSDGGVRQRQEAEARRAKKRRKKKPMKTIQILKRVVPDAVETVSETTVNVEDASGDADMAAAEAEGDSSSSLEHGHHHYRSTPSTPPRTNRVLVKRDVSLKHSKSTPTLKVNTIPPDPQLLKLRCLAHKLRLRFPENYERITTLLTQDFSGGESDFSDPRGPAPRGRDTLIHVFIDQLRHSFSRVGQVLTVIRVYSSNILIGLLTHHKRHRSGSRRPKRLSHGALALLLERGRPITRRCLVTSSPLYQPMDSAIQLGYDVRVYARVPDNAGGPGRRQPHPPDASTSLSANWRKSDSHSASTSLPSSSKTHARGHSTGNISTDSDRATGNGSRSGSVARGVAGPLEKTTRTRYREQGVDELLQLKLHQAIAATDPPPPNATIVLATGDGNVGQFNEEGFLGPVRLALQRGWKIELYAWEEGLSRAWRRTFSDGPWKERFRIIKMEDFADDLLEVDPGEGR
ncbi:hypothetical protein JVT61DRAFT_1556 [Boletus reticuloceps]|uniref:Uncharacterized protein n=1 Tax=Boletus reticuloceps TaxID=495285 RepID=A0A8I3AAT9_9AGAM|nr:hypothetical protein JVT61DRAFT_1556 [Boletus reticuloceps]